MDVNGRGGSKGGWEKRGGERRESKVERERERDGNKNRQMSFKRIVGLNRRLSQVGTSNQPTQK